ncbi:MAG: hypothetical protein QW400_02785, partial [Candidatus Diapherotrites archaeon]
EVLIDDLANYYGPDSWPGQITGTASDELSGVDKVWVAICYTQGGIVRCWDGDSWAAPAAGGVIWVEATYNNGTWSYNISEEAFERLDGTEFEVSVMASDEAANQAEGTGDSFTWDSVAPNLSVNPFAKQYYGFWSWPEIDSVTGTASDYISGIYMIALTFCYTENTTKYCWCGETLGWGDECSPAVFRPEYNENDGTWSMNVDAGIFYNKVLDGKQINAIAVAIDNAKNESEEAIKSFIWDETAPEVTIDEFDAIYGPGIWPDWITGTASDELSDINFVTLQICYTNGSTYCWNGFDWVESEITVYPTYNAESDTWIYDINHDAFENLNGIQINVIANAVDNASNFLSEPTSDSFIWDGEGPESSVHNLNEYYGPENWPGTITGSVTDELSEVGEVRVAICYEDEEEDVWCWDGYNWETPTEDVIWIEATYNNGTWSYNISEEAFTGLDGHQIVVRVKASDSVGNEEEGNGASFVWDETGPVVTIDDLEDYYGPNSWPGQITGTASDGDNGSGVGLLVLTLCYAENETKYCWKGDTWAEGEPAPLHPDYDEENEEWSLDVIANFFGGLGGKRIDVSVVGVDIVGNESDPAEASFTWDETAPTVDINPIESTWTGEPIGVDIIASDEENGSGVYAFYYVMVEKEDECPAVGSDDYTEVKAISGRLTIHQDGEWMICAYAKDNAGNVPEQPTSTGPYQYDAGAPVLEEEGSMYSHADKVLALLFDDELTALADEPIIYVSYDPEIEGFAIDEGDICSIDEEKNNFVVCILSTVHRDLIQSWYLEGHRELYIFVGAETVEDKAGNPNPDTTTTITGEAWIPQGQGEIVLEQGWNFISVPLPLANDSTEEVLGLEEGDAVYYYFNGSWTQPEKIEPLKGYLVYKATPSTRELTYDYDCSIQQVPPTVTVVGNKWNMIGPPKGGGESGEIPIDDFLKPELYNYVSDRIFTYSNVLGSYILVTENVNVGTGYWVFFRSTATIPGTPCYTEELI